MSRRIPTVAGARIKILIGALLGVAILVSGLAVGMSRYREGAGLLDHGRRTTATVESQRRFKRAQDVWIAYRVGGQAFRNEVNVGVDWHRQLVPGSLVPVVYLPEDPQESAIDPENLRDNGRELLILALPGFLIVSGVCIGNGLLELRRALR
jgi:hypothetical protein